MLSELLPSPDLHDDWRSFARALITSLENIAAQAQTSDNVTYITTTTPVSPGQLPAYPGGWLPIWLNSADALLYLGNPDYNPPTAANIVYIDTAKIADAAIETNKLANAAVTTAKILDSAVSELKIANDAVTSAKIATDAVGSLEIASAAVINAKIADAAVDTTKIANLAVTQALIANAAVGNAQIADLAVSTAKIQLLAVTEALIGNAAVVEAKIGNAAVVTAKIQDAAIVNAKIADATILGAKLVDATIVTAKIANAAIVSALIGDLQVVEAKIGDLAVNEGKIANAAITSAKIANLAVGAAHIQSAVIGTGHIVDAAITNAKIGNVIQSSSWDETTKAGWHIDKSGLIRGQGVAIYDTDGNLVFGSGGTVAWSAITGADKPANYATSDAAFFLNGNPDNNFTLTGNTYARVSGTTGYVSAEAYASGIAGAVRVSGKPSSIMQIMALGLGAGFAADLSVGYQARVNADGTVDAYNGNTLVQAGISSGVDGNSVIEVIYDNVTVKILHNGTVKYTWTGVAAGQSLNGHWWISTVGARWEKMLYTPYTDNNTQSLGGPQLTALGTNILGQFTSANISTYIAGAAIGTALIANAAIGTALIADGAILNAKIADGTILTAKIGDAQITNAKIASVDAAKITATSLSAITATIGLLRTASSGARLEIEDNQIRVYDSSNVLRVRMGIW